MSLMSSLSQLLCIVRLDNCAVSLQLRVPGAAVMRPPQSYRVVSLRRYLRIIVSVTRTALT